MKSAFVFFTPNICNVGGAEFYVNNKISRLKANAFDVFVFSFNKGEVMLPNLKDYLPYIETCLRLNPSIYTKHYRNHISKRIIAIINPSRYKEVFVESTEINASLWAELISSKIGAKHIFMDLQEKHSYSETIKKYLLFKYKTNSLYGINKQSINSIFGSRQEQMEERFIVAECVGGISRDIGYAFDFESHPHDFAIGSIGRLDKPSSLKSIVDFAAYCNRHSNYKFLLFLIGDGNSDSKSNILKALSFANNVETIITGYLSPIPYNLINKIDCFFSSAGSSRLTEKENIPTITIDVISGKAIGILNYTTVNTVYAEKQIEDEGMLWHCLDLILFEDYCKNNCKIQNNLLENVDFNKEFQKQLSFYNNIPRGLYYPQKDTKERNVKWFFYKIASFFLTGSVFNKLQLYLHKKRRTK